MNEKFTIAQSRERLFVATLLDEVLAAHGGLLRWRELSAVRVGLGIWGQTWTIKGQSGLFDRVTVEAATTKQALTVYPFVADDCVGHYSGDRVRIVGPDAGTHQDRLNPRGSFDGHTLETPWDHLHSLYFSGYALWNYLNLPFLATWPGFTTEEVAPYHDKFGANWRRLRVSYPPNIHTHNPVQDLLIDSNGLIFRHDYAAEVIGAGWAAHCLYGYAEFDGFMYPTRRRVFRRSEDLHPLEDLVLIGIDVVTDYVLS